ncbi:thiamine phosphate synthase [Neoactinobaculum massilliense]|uniref:thiamine phosphate synthase n=1 Tax=Neoactinobaculum massilliense TaxID=2364794 RepID=UPI000F54095F|nr:thiamine phosphate synthase [Neoactinobaculum massilliense]
MIDWRCYVITRGSGPEVVRAAADAAQAGAGVVQVRAKELGTRDLMAFANSVARAVHAAHPTTRVVIDDRADVVFALRRAHSPIHGVHLGQDDLPAADARAMLGPDAIIGLTTGTLELVRGAQAIADTIDYVGCGPFRPTPTKDSGRLPIGVEGYGPLVGATRLPLIAIGDVEPGDVPALAAQGVAGVAMVRAVMQAEDPAAVVRDVLAGWHM